MLLAADNGKDVGILHVPDAPAGTQVTAEGLAPADRQISFKEFQTLKLRSVAGTATLDGKPLLASGHRILIDRDIEGSIR
jgi:hypothetical protein